MKNQEKEYLNNQIEWTNKEAIKLLNKLLVKNKIEDDDIYNITQLVDLQYYYAKRLIN